MSNPSKIQAEVVRLEPRGDGIYLVEFSVPARSNRFIPGQFLHLTVDEFDPSLGFWPESRVFSIASEPRTDRLVVVYSVKGVYTKRMEAELQVGRVCWLKYPYGDFCIRPAATGGPVVLLAGGTGVSPFIPFLLQARDNPPDTAVHLYYGIRKASHQLFAAEIASLAGRPWFRGSIVVEETDGRLDIGRVSRDLGEAFSQATFYLSGPPPMIQAFRTELARREVPETHIKTDEWE